MSDKLKQTIQHGDRAVQIFERSTWIWMGTFAAPMVTEIYYATEAPSGWPKVQVRARRGFGAMFYKPGRKSEFALDDGRFNRAFKVTTKDRDFAIMLLTPEIQQYMLRKTGVDWSFGDGCIKLWYRGSLKKKRIPQSLERLDGLLELISPELDIYGDTNEYTQT
jgi:hypothetical protein